MVVLGGERGLRFVLVLRGVFFSPWSMALEAFTLDRMALPFYEEHIQIGWEEGRQAGREKAGTTELAIYYKSLLLAPNICFLIVKMNVVYGIISYRKEWGSI